MISLIFIIIILASSVLKYYELHILYFVCVCFSLSLVLTF
jgi:hypothetical protein